MPEGQSQMQQEVDDKGVPLVNRIKELERKFQEKYDKEMAAYRQELEQMKGRFAQVQEPEVDPSNTENMTRAELMEFVKNPKGYVQNAWRDVEFQREVPAAESWIKQQKGYSAEDDARVFQIIKENKLDTPYHSPMERARTAWRLLSAEKGERQTTVLEDERKRQETIAASGTEGMGLATPKQAPVTRQDIIRKLADAEAKGDLDAAIRYTSMLEDIR